METTKWVLDPMHSELGFKIKHLMIAHVSGSFNKFQIAVETENDDFTTARIQLTADINSIYTNNEQRDQHLLNSDFFEAAKYPELKFQSTRIEKINDGLFSLHGNLTMKGVTKPVTLNVEYSKIAKDPWGNARAGFMVTGKINRSEWGVNFNSVLESGGIGLSEEVKISSEVQLIKQAEQVAA
jgi:polyisoprenoid-binding protein YceI